MASHQGKKSACNAGYPGLIPGSGGAPGEGTGYPLQYPCLENPMDGGAWRAAVHGVTKSQTRLSDHQSLSCEGAVSVSGIISHVRITGELPRTLHPRSVEGTGSQHPANQNRVLREPTQAGTPLQTSSKPEQGAQRTHQGWHPIADFQQTRAGCSQNPPRPALHHRLPANQNRVLTEPTQAGTPSQSSSPQSCEQ